MAINDSSATDQPAVIEQLPSVTHSLHPLSLVFEIAHLVRTNLIPTVFASFSAASGGIVGGIIGLTIFGGAILASVFKYLTFRYTFTDSKLLIDQGLIFRRHRSVPIERIQNIDSVQNIFHRLMGVAEVRIETASGNEPEAIMRVVTLAEVEQLRANLAARNRLRFVSKPAEEPALISSLDTHVGSELTPHVVVNEEFVPVTLLSISTTQLFLAGVISNRGMVLVSLAIGYFWQARFAEGRWGVATRDLFNYRIHPEWLLGHSNLVMSLLIFGLLLSLMLVLRLASAAWYILKFHGYQLQARGEDLVIRCGLLTQVSATVPRGRVQVVSVQRTWLARKLGLAAIRIETLGGSGKAEEDASATVARRWFVPVVSQAQLPEVLRAIDPTLDWHAAHAQWHPLSAKAFPRMIRIPLILAGIASLVGIAVMLLANSTIGSAITLLSLFFAVLLVFRAWRKSKSLRFARTEDGFVYRSGTLTQKTSFGFWNRLQDIDLIEGPFDRRWQMASLRFDTAGAGTAEHELLVIYLDRELASREYAAAKARMALVREV